MRKQFEAYKEAAFVADLYSCDDEAAEDEADLLKDFILSLTDYATRFPQNVTFRWEKDKTDEICSPMFDVVVHERNFHCPFRLSYYNIMTRLCAIDENIFCSFRALEKTCKSKILIVDE